MDDVAAVKTAGEKAGNYVRNSLSSPMPAWNDTDEATTKTKAPPSKNVARPISEVEKAAPERAGAAQETPSGVQTFAVKPSDTVNEPSLTIDSDDPSASNDMKR